MDDPAKARQWGERAWQAALADPEPGRLAATAHVANTVELLDAALDLAPYADALAGLADAGRLDIEPSWNTCEGLAVPLRTQAARDTLRDALPYPDGSPRLAVAIHSVIESLEVEIFGQRFSLILPCGPRNNYGV